VIPRRTPLARGAGPARRTPLIARTQLARSSAARPQPARTAPADSLPAATRAAVYARAAGRCEICGCTLRAGWRSVQHRARRGSGGSRDGGRHRLSNLLAVCGPDASAGCHHRADCGPDRYDDGHQVHRGEDPAAVPVLYRGARVLIDDQGGIRPAAVAA
jgi:hypothetical protein